MGGAKAERVQSWNRLVMDERGDYVMTKTGPPIDRQRLSDFCRRWRIIELALFGSVLRNTFRPDSDVDVLVTFEPEVPWSLWDLSLMRGELEELFGRNVDLVEKKGLRNPFRRQAILSDARVIYAA